LCAAILLAASIAGAIVSAPFFAVAIAVLPLLVAVSRLYVCQWGFPQKVCTLALFAVLYIAIALGRY